MSQTRISFRVTTACAWATVSFAALALAGCGSKDEPAATATTAAPAADAPAESTPQRAGLPEDQKLANAVVTAKTAAAVDLKYDILSKPAVGTPFEVEMVFLPRVAADVLEVEVTGIPGLALVSGGASRFEPVNPGDRHSMRVLVRADGPGVYYVGVAAKMSTPVQTDARTFSVPVVVGDVRAAEKPAPETDASGQPVESMPAAEDSPSPGPTDKQP